MTITINPFVAGILATVIVEFIGLVAYAVYISHKH